MANSTTDTTAVSDTSDSLTSETTTPPSISLELPSSDVLGDNALLQVGPDTATTLTGSDGQDILIGGIGDDRLVGGEEEDVLVGGGGNNVLEGGSGDDIFGHAAGATDTIADFEAGEDEKLALADGLSVTTSSQETVTADLGNGASSFEALVLTLSDNSTIALIGVTEQFSTDWLTSASA